MKLLLDTSVLGWTCQAIAEGAAVVAANVRHFENVVRAMTWKDVPEG